MEATLRWNLFWSYVCDDHLRLGLGSSTVEQHHEGVVHAGLFVMQKELLRVVDLMLKRWKENGDSRAFRNIRRGGDLVATDRFDHLRA